jgi:hypothetical protein
MARGLHDELHDLDGLFQLNISAERGTHYC